MEVRTPTTEQIAALRAEHAHRFPQDHWFAMLGDRGAPVSLPLVLGNPSGACAMQRQTPIWGLFVSHVLGLAELPANPDALGAFDCVLYPDISTFSQWCERWPELPREIWKAVKEKVGYNAGIYDEPSFDAELPELPEPVRKAADAHRSAVLCRFRPHQKKTERRIVCVLDRPASVAWRFFGDASRKPDADRWQLIKDLSQASIRIAVDEDTGQSLDLVRDVFAPWPGIAILAFAKIANLAGLGAKVELGEFLPE